MSVNSLLIQLYCFCCAACILLADRVLRQHNKNGITGQTIGTGNSPPPSSGGGGGSGLPSVHLNMVLDDDTAEQLARFVVRFDCLHSDPLIFSYPS